MMKNKSVMKETFNGKVNLGVKIEFHSLERKKKKKKDYLRNKSIRKILKEKKMVTLSNLGLRSLTKKMMRRKVNLLFEQILNGCI